jgi:hypothetical protein
LARKERLLAMYKIMIHKKIKFLLVQINEAHSSKWPIGLTDQVEPQKSFPERVERAREFIKKSKPQYPFIVCVDGQDNCFDNRFRIWPDKFYFINKKYKVLAKSSYGKKADGLIDVDCLEILEKIVG